MILVDTSLTIMKTAYLIFQNVEKTLIKAKNMHDFKDQIDKSIENFKSEKNYKKSIKEFYVNKALFFYIRRIFISNENPNVSNDERFKKYVPDRFSIFGINSITGFSENYLNELQPNYFSKGGIGRIKMLSNLQKSQRVFSLDNFMREEALQELEKIKEKFNITKKKIIFPNVLGFNENSDSEMSDEEESRYPTANENKNIFSRNFKIDKRAKFNVDDFSGSKALVTNKPMLIGNQFKVIIL